MFNEIFNNLIEINQVFDKDKKVVIFGAGSGGKTTFFVLKKLSISPVCFVDNDPSLMGSKMFDIPIEAPSSLFNKAKEDLIILIASVYYDEISIQLINMGFAENINYFRLLTPKKISVLKETTFFPEFGFSVGKYSYGYQQFYELGRKCKILKSIGAFCSIAQNVTIAASNHPLDCISTHPFFYGKRWGFVEENSADVVKAPEKNRPVVIGNDVWVGINVTILPSVEIGDGAVIGAGAVVTKSVPDYAIVVGAPARVIRYRFSEEEIKILKEIRWWDWPDEKIRENIKYFANNEEFFKKTDNIQNCKCVL